MFIPYYVVKAPRRSFLRRTKATPPPPPETGEAETTTVSGVATNKFPRRGGVSFKNRNDIEKDTAKNETGGIERNEVEKRTRPSFNSGARRNERPQQATRNFARRRPGGANVSSTTPAPSSGSTTTRRGFNFAPRRRPVPSSTTTTTTTTTTTEQPTTLAEDPVDIEESLKNIGDTDGIEDPTLDPQEPKKTNKIQKRPLVTLKDESNDQNPSATNEDESKRQSKKYSASINQNQLEDLLKLNTKEMETTTEYKTTIEELSAETALAIATHQLVTAPLPNTQSFDENTKPATQTTQSYKYTSPQYNEFTDSKTPAYTQEEYPSTPTFRTTGITDFAQTTSRDAFSVSQFESPKISTTSFETTYPVNTLSTQNFRQTYSTVLTEAPEAFSTSVDVPRTSLPISKLSYSTTDYDSPRISSTNYPLTNPTSPNTFAITESKGYPSTDYETTSYNPAKLAATFPNEDLRQLEYFTISNAYQENNDYIAKTTRGFTSDPSEFTTPTYVTPRKRYTTTPSSNTIIEETSDPTIKTTRQFTTTPTEYTTPDYVTLRRRYTTTPTSSNIAQEISDPISTVTRQLITDPTESTIPTYVTPRRRYTTTTTSNTINEETTDYITRTRQFTNDPTEFTTPTYVTPRRRYTTTTTSNTINQETTDYITKTRQFTSDPTEFTTPTYVTPRRRYTTTPSSNTVTQEYFETTRNNIPTGFTSTLSTTFNTEPTVFTARTRQRISTTTDPAFTETAQTPASSSGRFRSTKYVTVPVEEQSSPGYSVSSQDPSYLTREYLLESPVTKSYDDEYQYLTPVTTPRAPPRKKVFRKKIQRRISTTLRPTTPGVPTTTTTTPQPTVKPFDKVPVKTFRPIVNYDYYDDSEEKVVEKYVEGTKVVLHNEGTIECLDVGNFPHPSSCKKFISCARMEGESLIGWEYICPKGLSFDPVGGICNWSAGLGCEEKDS